MKIRSHFALMASAALIPGAVLCLLTFGPAIDQERSAALHTMHTAALGLVVALACACAVALLFGRRIVIALDGAARSAKALSSGEQVPLPASGVEEIDRLNRSLAEVAAELEQSRAEQEKLLAETRRGRELAETQNRAKDQFLAMLGHELRNPLAPISTAAQILKLPGLDEERVGRTREIIERQVAQLTRLVDELIDVSRVSRGLVVLQNDALDLNSVLLEAVEQVRPVIEERHHKLSIHHAREPAWVVADRERMIQVVANLLHNAAKFTENGGLIELRVEAGAEVVALSVRDNGCGISPELLPYVFDLFTQSDRLVDHSQGGLGLGLSLVKGLVELHDGSVSAFSEGEGKGSEFRIELARLANAPEHHDGQSANGSLDIVVVDDNTDAAETLAMYLKASFGYQVWVYQDSESALAHALSEPPDAFVLDIGLPGMDGYELARRLRSEPTTAGALLIAVTGYGQLRDRELAEEAGFDFHLTKPADPEELAGLLSRMALAH